MEYVEALLRDLEQDLPAVWGRRVQTIFIGGGTPSLFTPDALEALLTGVRTRIPVSPEAEITLEANPGTVETDRFRGFRQAGVNRLSIGVQSFDDAKLVALGRIHDGAAAARAADAAHAAGFSNFNLDLMYALPGQTVAQAQSDLAAAIALRPTHLSIYQLTLEPNTLFHRAPPALPDDDTAFEMQQRLHAQAADAGYVQYEVSAYAQAGARCRHNLNYWQFGDYLGIGAGAHGKLTDHTGIVRTAKARQPRDYLAKAGTAAGREVERRLSAADAAFEFMLNALRLNGGFSLDLFCARTGLAAAALEPALSQAQARHWLVRDGDAIRTTELGARFLNDVLQNFLPPGDTGTAHVT